MKCFNGLAAICVLVLTLSFQLFSQEDASVVPLPPAPATKAAVTGAPAAQVIQIVLPSTNPSTTAPVVIPVTDPEPSWWSKLITAALVAIAGLFTTATGSFFIWLASKVKLSQAAKDAMDALHAGVDKTYLTLYQQFKDAAADGQISAAEGASLRQNAINEAMNLAKGPALDFLKSMAFPLLESLVQRIVASKKASTTVVAAPNTITTVAPAPTA